MSAGITGDRSVLELELGRRFLDLTDRNEAVDLVVEEQMAVHERSAGVTRALVGAAAADPDLDAERGWLRDDVPFDELVATTAVISSIETYTRMVHRDGWTVDAYRAWFRRMLDEVVLSRRR